MRSEADKRFINFPLFLLSDTHTAPKRGLTLITSMAFVEYAQHCRRDYTAALLQAVYQSQRHPDKPLPADVRDIMSREDVSEFAVTAAGEAWGDGSQFTTGAAEMIEDYKIELNESEQQALVNWLALRDAAFFFGRQILDFEGIYRDAAAAGRGVQRHASEHGPLVSASIPGKYFFETISKASDPEAMRLFRCVAAVRSLVGSKRFTGTTKDMLRARMIGAKSAAVAEAMAAQSEALRVELKALGSRKRFDRILTEGATRGFYVKLGMGRRIYLSLDAANPEALGVMIGKRFNRQAQYRTREAAARELVAGAKPKGQQGGSKGGTEGGSFNKSLSIRLNSKNPLLDTSTGGGVCLPEMTEQHETETAPW